MSNNIKAIVAILLCVAAGLCTSAPSQIAFQSNQDGPWNIYVINDDGTDERRLTFSSFEGDADQSNNEEPAFSRDGSRIAFARQSGTGDYDIWVMNIDGSNAMQLTTTLDEDRFPAFSPDGTQIAFQRGIDGDNDIFVMDAFTGQNVTRIMGGEGLDGADDEQPEYFPDGLTIGFYRVNDNGHHIWKKDLSSGLETMIGGTWGRVESGPTISPDGALIAYQGGDDQYVDDNLIVDAEVFLVNADGSSDSPTHVTNNDVFPGTDWARSDGAPSWSLDSSRIAFQADASPGFNIQIFTINAGGTERTQLTYGGGLHFSPSYGPPQDPTSIGDCMHGKWQAFGFRNQGLCIQLVNTGLDSR